MSKILTVVLRERADSTNLLILAVLVLTLIVAAYVVLVVPNVSYVAIWLHDVMALTNASYRTYMGQVPSVDFNSLYGVAVYYPAVLGFHLGFDASNVLYFGQVVVAALLLPMAAVASYRRLPLLLSVILILFLFFLIVAPMPPGLYFKEISLASFYNRHCWAALTIVLLYYLEPRILRRSDGYVDAFVQALLLLFIFYSKITFAAVALAFAVANGLTSKWKFQMSTVSLGIFALAIGTVELLTQYNTAYLGDVLRVVQSNLPSGSTVRAYSHFVHINSWVVGSCLLALAVVYLAGRRRFFDAAFVLGNVVASIWLLGYTGGTSRGLPSLVVVFLICSELARRAEQSGVATETQDYWPKHAASLGAAGLLVVFVAGPMLDNALALRGFHTKASRGVPEVVGSSRFVVRPSPRPSVHEVIGDNAEALAGLAELRRNHLAMKHHLNSAEYWASVVEGSRLLERVPLEGRAVVVFSVTDPFSALLSLRPTEYGFPYLWPGGAFSRETHPEAEQIFSDTDYVMVPVIPLYREQLDMMMEVYGAYLEEHFEDIERSEQWVLWARKGLLDSLQ